jgi:hypothetical protein
MMPIVPVGLSGNCDQQFFVESLFRSEQDSDVFDDGYAEAPTAVFRGSLLL